MGTTENSKSKVPKSGMWKVGGTEKQTSNFCTLLILHFSMHTLILFVFFFTNSQGKFVTPNIRESGHRREFQILHTKDRGNHAKFQILNTLRITILTISNAWSSFVNLILSSLLFHQSNEIFLGCYWIRNLDCYIRSNDGQYHHNI